MTHGVIHHDIAGKTAPLVVVDSPAWRGKAGKQEQDAIALLRGFRDANPAGIQNNDTGWRIRITSEGIGKTVHFKQRAVGFHALEKLPELLVNAVLARESLDKKGRWIEGFAVLYAPVRVEGKIYAAEITVKKGGDGGKSFYLQRLMIKKPAVSIATESVGTDSALVGTPLAEAASPPPPAGSLISIIQLLRDVKSEDSSTEAIRSDPSGI